MFHFLSFEGGWIPGLIGGVRLFPALVVSSLVPLWSPLCAEVSTEFRAPIGSHETIGFVWTGGLVVSGAKGPELSVIPSFVLVDAEGERPLAGKETRMTEVASEGKTGGAVELAVSDATSLTYTLGGETVGNRVDIESSWELSGDEAGRIGLQVRLPRELTASVRIDANEKTIFDAGEIAVLDSTDVKSVVFSDRESDRVLFKIEGDIPFLRVSKVKWKTGDFTIVVQTTPFRSGNTMLSEFSTFGWSLVFPE